MKNGYRFSCIGASSMGDVWLTRHFERENGYDLRIDVAECSEWGAVPNTQPIERKKSASKII